MSVESMMVQESGGSGSNLTYLIPYTRLPKDGDTSETKTVGFYYKKDGVKKLYGVDGRSARIGGMFCGLDLRADQGSAQHDVAPKYILSLIIGKIDQDSGEIVPTASLELPVNNRYFGKWVNRLLGGDFEAMKDGTASISASLWKIDPSDEYPRPNIGVSISSNPYSKEAYPNAYSREEIPAWGDHPTKASKSDPSVPAKDPRTERLFWVRKMLTELLPNLQEDGTPFEIPRHPALVTHYMQQWTKDNPPGKPASSIEYEFKSFVRDMHCDLIHPDDFNEVLDVVNQSYARAGGKNRLTASGLPDGPPMGDGQAASPPAATTPPASEQPPGDFPKADPKQVTDAEIAAGSDLPF